MHRAPFKLLGLATLVSALLVPQWAAAQGMTLEILSVTGRDEDALSGTTPLVNTPVNIAECESEEEVLLSVRVNNIPTDKAVLDFWRGSNCNDASQRDQSQGKPNCEHLTLSVDTSINGNATREFAVPLKELLDAVNNTTGDPVPDGLCDGDNALTTYSIFLLALDMPNTNQEAGGYTYFEAKVDLNPPRTPINVSGGSGDTQIPVSWDLPDNQEMLRAQWVYALPAGSCVDGEFVGAEDGGDDADAGVSGWQLQTDASPTSKEATLSGAKLGLAYGEEAAVAVVAVDLARNISEFSAPACVRRVNTDGFCDVHSAAGGKCESCAVRAPGHGRGSLPVGTALLLGFAGVWCVVRRRR